MSAKVDRAVLESALGWLRDRSGRAFTEHTDYVPALVSVVEAHLTTLPAEPMKVWHVCYARRVDTAVRHQWEPEVHVSWSEDSATRWADDVRNRPGYAYVHVTGPHEQEIPA